MFNADAFSTQNGKSFIKSGGEIKIIDEDPGAYLTILLHELGHVVSPWSVYSNFPNDDKNEVYQISAIRPYDGKYPFDKSLSCLGKIAPPTDVNCIKTAKANPNGLVCTSKDYLDGITRVLLSNPWADRGLQRACAIDTNCQLGRFDEAFADWFAAKIIGELVSGELPVTLPFSTDRSLIESGGALYCALSAIQGTSGPSEQDEHPKVRVRLNEIYFANPKIRRTFGCHDVANRSCP
jgi:hypothetical protein